MDHLKLNLKSSNLQWKSLAHNDWGEILELSRKKAFQRKFQIVEAFTTCVAEKGLQKVTHLDLAQRCGVTRQLVDHHFPTSNSLILLTYRYIYSRLQKQAADAIMTRKSFVSRFKAYLESCASWIEKHPADVRFLIHFYAVAPLDKELFNIHERNTKIGQERLSALFRDAKAEGLLSNFDDLRLLDLASSVQQQLIGYMILTSLRKSSPLAAKKAREDLFKTCLSILSIRAQSN